MFLVFYTLIWLTSLLILCLLSFFVGRCARKLPVIDDGLPWVMHRCQLPAAASDGPDDLRLPPGQVAGKVSRERQAPAGQEDRVPAQGSGIQSPGSSATSRRPRWPS